jgi:hypothetical protein
LRADSAAEREDVLLGVMAAAAAASPCARVLC